MEAQKKAFGAAPQLSEEAKLQINDPMVVILGSFFLGYVISSGRLPDFGRSLAKVGQSIGSFAMLNFAQTIKEKNPKLFQLRDSG
jgi:hypothetical protein